MTISDEIDRPAKESEGRISEFVAVWSLLAGIALCPWVSTAALSREGQFAPPTTALLWLLCGGAFAVSFCALLAFLRAKQARGESAARALRLFAVHLTASFGILLAGLIVADVAVGRIRPLPAAGHLDVPKAQIYGWAFAPHQPIVIADPDTGDVYHEQSNSEGWRDVEHRSEKSRARLLVLGDSQVFGVGLPFDQTIGHHLQGLLGERWEVIAIALSGWGTDQQFLFLENEGWTYEPDLVVLLFTAGNDVMNNMYDRAFFGTARKPAFRLVGDRLELQPLPRSHPSVLRRLFGHSAICRHLRFWQETRPFKHDVHQLRYARMPGESPWLPVSNTLAEDMENDYSHASVLGESWSHPLTQGWHLTLRLIEEIDQGCRSHDAAFVLYAYGQPPPPVPRVKWTNRGKTYWLDPDKPFRLLREFCEDKAIAYLDEPLDFRKGYATGELRFRDQGHLNALGSRRTAENIAHWLAQHDMLSDSQAGETATPQE